MLSVFILVVSSIAVLYLLFQLIKAGKQGRFVQTLRDLLIIFLAILISSSSILLFTPEGEKVLCKI